MLIIILCLIALLVGVITDIKLREVPDWLSFSCIFAGVGIALINTIIQKSWSFILNSIAGLALAVILGVIMYYTGQWGGGDSKLLMGLGALLGLEVYELNSASMFNSFLVSFFVNIMLVGSVYGIIWVLVLAIKNWKRVVKQFKDIRHSKDFTRLRWIFFFFVAIIVIFGLVSLLNKNILNNYYIYIVLLVLFGFFLSYVWVFVKAVENLSMVKKVDVSKLTEGDWIYKDVMVNGKRICGPKDLGISRKQIKNLLELKRKKKIRSILIKEGIPFVPSFLIAFILTIFFGNLLVLWLL